MNTKIKKIKKGHFATFFALPSDIKTHSPSNMTPFLAWLTPINGFDLLTLAIYIPLRPAFIQYFSVNICELTYSSSNWAWRWLVDINRPDQSGTHSPLGCRRHECYPMSNGNR
jgi:hypothetical protein